MRNMVVLTFKSVAVRFSLGLFSLLEHIFCLMNYSFHLYRFHSSPRLVAFHLLYLRDISAIVVLIELLFIHSSYVFAVTFFCGELANNTR